MSGTWDYATSHLALLGQRILEHLYLSGAALFFAMLIALPLALWLGHIGKGAFIAINSSNIGRALPSLGLIALFVSLPTFGLHDRSTIAALVLLGIPPILTNAYTGIREVDREVVEAARGMGLTEFGILRQVELPLAAPVIMAGIRTSAVQIVATATLAAVVAGGGLGRFIVDGLSVRDYPQLITGSVAVALLTVLTEILLGWIERRMTPKGLAVGRGAEERTTAPGPADPTVGAGAVQ
jgi:osmoprotectant transport system permease protein